MVAGMSRQGAGITVVATSVGRHALKMISTLAVAVASAEARSWSVRDMMGLEFRRRREKKGPRKS